MEQFFIPYQAVSSLPGHRVAVLAPHADDEVFGCGGALASFVAQGRSVHVVVVSDEGDQATPPLRHAESRTAAEVIGYAPPTFWGLADGQLFHSETLADRIRVWLLEVDADLVLVTSCWEMHRDHRALAEATIRAVVALEGRVRIAFYEVGQPLPSPNTLLDITPWKEVKERAMACFPSQLVRQRYDQHIAALNLYRTYSLPSTVQAAEAYLMLTAEDLIARGLDKEPQALSQILHQMGQEREVLEQNLAESRKQNIILNQCMTELLASTSWRVTAPMRFLGHLRNGDGSAVRRVWGLVGRFWHSWTRYFPKVGTPAQPDRLGQRPQSPDPVVRAPAMGGKRWQIDVLPESRSAEMAPLYQRIFGKPLDPAFREWKYGQGRGRVFGAWNGDGTLVAHYGGLVRTVSFFGEPVDTCQVGDVMVDPAERGVLTRKGVFFQMTQAFYESQDRRARQAAFGFPNHRAFKVGQRLGFYASAGRIYLRTWNVGPTKTAVELHPLWEIPHWRILAQELWLQMQAESLHLVLVQRDPEYLDYRYRQRPDGHYGVYLIGPAQSGQAIVVIKQRGEVLDWMDFVGTPAQAGMALAGVKRLAKSRGANQIQAWLTQPMQDAFPDEAAVTHETDIEVAQWDCAESHGGAEVTKGRWWAMYGDTDFL